LRKIAWFWLPGNRWVIWADDRDWNNFSTTRHSSATPKTIGKNRGNGTTRSESRSTTKSRAKLVWLSASQLVNAYQNNEISADQWFKHSGVTVKGRVDTIGKDIIGSPYITLTDGNLDGIRRVQAFFDDEYELLSITRGQSATVDCVCDGLALNVILRHCRFPLKSEIGKQYR
jgi:hypothetical protein